MVLIQIKHTTTRINHHLPNIQSITTLVIHQITQIIQMDLILIVTKPTTILIHPLLIVLAILHPTIIQQIKLQA